MTVLLAALAYIVALAFLLVLVGANRRAVRRLTRHAMMPTSAEALPDEASLRASNIAPLRPKRVASAGSRDAFHS